MKKRYYLPIILLSIVLVLISRQTVLAQDPTPFVSDDQVNALARELYCPVCENISLDVCPTTACSRWRELIREKMAAGWSDEQIKQYLVIQYGDRVLAEPPRQGLNWLVYILPPLFILGAIFVLVWVLRSMLAPGAAPEIQNPPETVDDPYLRRMEEELKQNTD
jgi:cytochrome c-type biogenesis protein CcmH